VDETFPNEVGFGSGIGIEVAGIENPVDDEDDGEGESEN
jgi:hypothetical protein